MSQKSLPIGIFDSGLGGLSVLRELVQFLPGEDFVYLGDVARLPYGNKSKSVVSKYAKTCVNFLKSQSVKAVVVACNTATAMALDDLQSEHDFPILGVIEPGVRAALSAADGKAVLVLATDSTVRSEAYLREFHRQRVPVAVSQLACPLLVPLVEEGMFDHPITEAVIRNYLSKVNLESFGSLLLGCTHYPLLEKSFEAVLGSKIKISHGAFNLSVQLQKALLDKNLLSEKRGGGSTIFFSTDQISRPLPIVSALFKQNVQFDCVDL